MTSVLGLFLLLAGATMRSYLLPGGGTLELQVPDEWQEHSGSPSPAP